MSTAVCFDVSAPSNTRVSLSSAAVVSVSVCAEKTSWIVSTRARSSEYSLTSSHGFTVVADSPRELVSKSRTIGTLRDRSCFRQGEDGFCRSRTVDEGCSGSLASSTERPDSGVLARVNRRVALYPFGTGPRNCRNRAVGRTGVLPTARSAARSRFVNTHRLYSATANRK